MHVEAAVALERARLLTEQTRRRRRKRKKRRKRRTPRTSSCSSRCRARRRPRRWHAPGWFSSVHAVFPSHVGRPQLPGIIVGMVQDDSLRSSSTLAVAYTGLVSLVFLLALCSSLSLAGPRCSASRPFWTRRTVTRFFLAVACARLVLLVLYTSRCVFHLVGRPMMLSIMAGMNQNESFLCALRRQRQLHGQGWFYWLRCTSCVFPLVGRPVMFGIMSGMDQKNTFLRISCRGAEVFSHGPDCSSDHRDSPVAREQGDGCPYYAVRAGSSKSLPVVCNDRCPRQLQFINKVVIIPFVAQRHVPMIKLFTSP